MIYYTFRICAQILLYLDRRGCKSHIEKHLSLQPSNFQIFITFVNNSHFFFSQISNPRHAPYIVILFSLHLRIFKFLLHSSLFIYTYPFLFYTFEPSNFYYIHIRILFFFTPSSLQIFITFIAMYIYICTYK